MLHEGVKRFPTTAANINRHKTTLEIRVHWNVKLLVWTDNSCIVVGFSLSNEFKQLLKLALMTPEGMGC